MTSCNNAQTAREELAARIRVLNDDQLLDIARLTKREEDTLTAKGEGAQDHHRVAIYLNHEADRRWSIGWRTDFECSEEEFDAECAKVDALMEAAPALTYVEAVYNATR